MKKNLIKKIAGVALGAALVAGVGGSLAAKASSSSAAQDSVLIDDESDLEKYGVVTFTDEQVKSYYDGLREKFNELPFEDKKAGMVDLLKESAAWYDVEGLSDSKQIADDCRALLIQVEGATTNEQLAAMVDKDMTLLNFLDI